LRKLSRRTKKNSRRILTRERRAEENNRRQKQAKVYKERTRKLVTVKKVKRVEDYVQTLRYVKHERNKWHSFI